MGKKRENSTEILKGNTMCCAVALELSREERLDTREAAVELLQCAAEVRLANGNKREALMFCEHALKLCPTVSTFRCCSQALFKAPS